MGKYIACPSKSHENLLNLNSNKPITKRDEKKPYFFIENENHDFRE